LSVERRALKHFFLIAAIAWAAALPLATFIASQAHPAAPLSLAGLAVYAAGSVICHQLPDRSFHLWSAQMPVCARCTGIYAGAAMAALGLLKRGRGSSVSPMSRDAARWTVLAAALPTAATLVFEWSSGLMPSNAVRALAGIPLGGAIAWVIGSAVAEARTARLQGPELGAGAPRATSRPASAKGCGGPP